MIKPLLAVAATGVAAVLVWNLMAIILLPLLGLAIGLAAFLIKMLVILFLLLIAYWLYRRMMRRDSMAA